MDGPALLIVVLRFVQVAENCTKLPDPRPTMRTAKPANSRGDGRYDALTSELLHEPVQKNGIHPLQRGLAGAPGAIHLRPPGVRKCEFPHEFTLELVQNRTG